MNCYYSVRFEVRVPGSKGAFRVAQFDYCTDSAAKAVELATAEASSRYELRFGGDWRYTDGGPDWHTLDGKLQPMLLPCQTEAVQS